MRAKAPPGPSLAPVPGPFPEMPGREKAGEGGWSSAGSPCFWRPGRAEHPSPAQAGHPPTFAPHDQLVKEIRHQVPALARGSCCKGKVGVRRARTEISSVVSGSGLARPSVVPVAGTQRTEDVAPGSLKTGPSLPTSSKSTSGPDRSWTLLGRIPAVVACTG